jgi:PEGA domain
MGLTSLSSFPGPRSLRPLGVRRGGVRWLSCALAGIVFGWTRPVLAEPPVASDASRVDGSTRAAPDAAAAAALLRQGVELRKANDDRGALAAFEQAFTLAGSPEALAQMALAEQALGHWVEAHEHMRQALEHTEQPWIAGHRATLEAALQEMASRLGTVEISCNVDGAVVRVDGRVLGKTPLDGPSFLLAGQSVIQVVAPGYFDVTRQVYVDAGALSRLDVSLTPTEVGSAASGSATGDSAGPRADSLLAPALPESTALGAAPAHAAGEASAKDYLRYGSLGVAALGLSIGVAGYALREVNVRVYNDDALCDAKLGPRRSEECPTEAKRVRVGEAMAIGGFSAAGVFGAVALYLWLDTPASTGTAVLGCGVGLGSISCSGQF